MLWLLVPRVSLANSLQWHTERCRKGLRLISTGAGEADVCRRICCQLRFLSCVFWLALDGDDVIRGEPGDAPASAHLFSVAKILRLGRWNCDLITFRT
jgi:hypothetical protein